LSKDVLMITTMEGAEHCAQWIAGEIGSKVEVAPNRRAGLAALRRAEFGVMVVEESLAEADTEWADQVWGLAGMAVPVQVNFAISGCARLSREVKAALLRRDGALAVARRAAVTEVENDLKSAVTGLLLESELALREPAVPASLEPKLRHLVELAGTLRERLEDRQRLGTGHGV
jgi:hypothetical protein